MGKTFLKYTTAAGESVTRTYSRRRDAERYLRKHPEITKYLLGEDLEAVESGDEAPTFEVPVTAAPRYMSDAFLERFAR